MFKLAKDCKHFIIDVLFLTNLEMTDEIFAKIIRVGYITNYVPVALTENMLMQCLTQLNKSINPVQYQTILKLINESDNLSPNYIVKLLEHLKSIPILNKQYICDLLVALHKNTIRKDDY
jgi:hypothetical protein